MNRLTCWKGLGAALFAAALALACFPAGRSAHAQWGGSKESLTPSFWQSDPEAGFEDEGRMHCAPTAVSDGLIYLYRAFRMKGLVPGTDHGNQIKLIKELAAAFETDPAEGGTNPDKILTGLQRYVRSKGYRLGRLELKSWRGVGAPNRQFKIGTKPDLPWVRAASRSADAVMICNFGWYYEGRGGYVRKGGHWVAVVGSRPDGTLVVHNPALPPDTQTETTAVRLAPLEESFRMAEDAGGGGMSGYYEGVGPGLPRPAGVRTVLDGVIVFSLKK